METFLTDSIALRIIKINLTQMNLMTHDVVIPLMLGLPLTDHVVFIIKIMITMTVMMIIEFLTKLLFLDIGIHFVTHRFSFVMKLFDRSVDFAQFNEDTPLYALARAWMQNKPYGTKSTDFQESGILDGDPFSSSQENIVSINHRVV